MAAETLEPPVHPERRAGAGQPGADVLCRQLRSQLGPFGYQWLCACAVYPKLRFALSTYLGAVLAARLDRPPPSEDEHLALFRLPWFQQGWLPEALRVRLVGDLDPRAAAGVREAIERALFSVEVQDTDPTVAGPVALAQPPRRWRAMLRAYWDGASPDAAENDRIFIRYMHGQAVTPDAIARQRWLERWLGRDLLALLRGGRALMLVGAASFVVAAAAADYWLKPGFQDIVQVAAPAADRGATAGPETDAEPPLADQNASDAAAAARMDEQRSRRELAELQRGRDLDARRIRVLEDALESTRQDGMRREAAIRIAAEAERERLIAERRDREALARVRVVDETAGDELPGGEVAQQSPEQSPIQRPLPTAGESYSRNTARSVQDRLKREGLYQGASDGFTGPATVAAIRAYQQREGLPVTGTITAELLERLGIAAEPASE
jgi:hypothetical protein